MFELMVDAAPEGSSAGVQVTLAEGAPRRPGGAAGLVRGPAPQLPLGAGRPGGPVIGGGSSGSGLSWPARARWRRSAPPNARRRGRRRSRRPSAGAGRPARPGRRRPSPRSALPMNREHRAGRLVHQQQLVGAAAGDVAADRGQVARRRQLALAVRPSQATVVPVGPVRTRSSRVVAVEVADRRRPGRRAGTRACWAWPPGRPSSATGRAPPPAASTRAGRRGRRRRDRGDRASAPGGTAADQHGPEAGRAQAQPDRRLPAVRVVPDDVVVAVTVAVEGRAPWVGRGRVAQPGGASR